MNKQIKEYYSHQGRCRNINTGNDVIATLELLAPSYNRIFRRWMTLEKSAPIHEVACGPGILLRWLKKEGFSNITACDIAEKEVELARLTGFEVAHGDAIKDLERFKENVSAILALDFIEHISRESALQFLRNSWKALRPGGRLILRMPNGDSPFVGRNLYNDITHEWAYTTTSFRAVAKICNFSKVEFLDDTLVSISKFRPLKYPVMWLAQAFLKSVFRAATHERFDFIGPSIYVCLHKD